MATITLAIPDKIKEDMNKLSWVNWSEIAKQELSKEEILQEELKKVRIIVSKSKLTEKDAEELANKINKSMHERLKKEGLI